MMLWGPDSRGLHGVDLFFGAAGRVDFLFGACLSTVVVLVRCTAGTNCHACGSCISCSHNAQAVLFASTRSMASWLQFPVRGQGDAPVYRCHDTLVSDRKSSICSTWLASRHAWLVANWEMHVSCLVCGTGHLPGCNIHSTPQSLGLPSCMTVVVWDRRCLAAPSDVTMP